MSTALIVIDVQQEFVKDPRLEPSAKILLREVADLLKICRTQRIPVLHSHFVTEVDGRGRLHHHRMKGIVRCLRGTPAADPATEATPEKGEPVFFKQSYSAFASLDLQGHLQALGIDTLLLCGLYTHACIRQTALDALERNFRVTIAENAIASYDPLHADVTKRYLAQRGVEISETVALIEQLSKSERREVTSPDSEMIGPVACIENRWHARKDEAIEKVRNPSDWEQILGYVPMACTETISKAVSSSVQSQCQWKKLPLEERMATVERLAEIFDSKAEEFLPHMIEEVGKPITACRLELDLLRQSLRVLRQTVSEDVLQHPCTQTPEQVALARRCPQGIVAILTPWNNPIFLPASKIAAAVALGNGVVWKPALPCIQTSMILQDSLSEAGIPQGLVNLVFGGAETGQRLVAHPKVDAVTLTGSIDTGRSVAAICGSQLKPLQAELGGNNATLVTEHCHLPEVADKIALSAFAYAGQACTATRRVIVEARILDEFMTLLKRSVQSLVIGDPHETNTIVGPVISKGHQQRIEQLLKDNTENEWVFRAEIPKELAERGCWVAPTIILANNAESFLVQHETFAPLLVVQIAADFAEAIRLCNAVPQGLISSIFCEDESRLKEFSEHVEAGVVQLNLPSRNLHMESPFSGWKASGLGPPEHGVWDLDFYTRWQAVNQARDPQGISKTE